MSRDRAAYMREYRARRKDELRQVLDELVPHTWAQDEARIAELEEEVRHLKAELAKRPEYEGVHDHAVNAMRDLHGQRFNTRPFTPVPKRRG